MAPFAFSFHSNRMRHRLRHLFVVASLVIALFSVVMIPVSYFRSSCAQFQIQHWRLLLLSDRGSLVISIGERWTIPHIGDSFADTMLRSSEPDWPREWHELIARDVLERRFGFGWANGDGWLYIRTLRFVAVPWWFLAIVSVLPAVIVIARGRRRQKRLLASACLVCGYDLRASPQRCPECGTPNPKATLPAS